MKQTHHVHNRFHLYKTRILTVVVTFQVVLDIQLVHLLFSYMSGCAENFIVTSVQQDVAHALNIINDNVPLNYSAWCGKPALSQRVNVLDVHFWRIAVNNYSFKAPLLLVLFVFLHLAICKPFVRFIQNVLTKYEFDLHCEIRTGIFLDLLYSYY